MKMSRVDKMKCTKFLGYESARLFCKSPDREHSEPKSVTVISPE